MKEVSKEVYMRVEGVRTRVGTATIQFAETVQEAIDLDGEARLLEKRNSQSMTNRMNDIRGTARSGPGTKALESRAYAAITSEEWMEVAGDVEAINALKDRKMAEIKAELAAGGVGG